MSDRAVRYGMIVLDAAPVILRARGTPVYFASPDEAIEYARLHEIMRWIVFGDPDGWWPLYTPAGPVNPVPEPKGASTLPYVDSGLFGSMPRQAASCALHSVIHPARRDRTLVLWRDGPSAHR